MAVDEALLESAATRGLVSLRFYSWSEPTLSLGYFQSYEDRVRHSASLECEVVRRCSGGGAIVHDRELTYAFATPCSDRFLAKPEQLYFAFHNALVELLGQRGIGASLHEGQGGRAQAAFLCFERRSQGDVVVEGKKVAGSAQRRRHAALLQHGSVLLQRSSKAPELPGLSELAGLEMRGSQLVDAWVPSLSRRLNVAIEPAALSDEESESANRRQQRRFGLCSWTRRR